MAGKMVSLRKRGAQSRHPRSFALQLNRLSREIDTVLLARAGGLVLSAVAGLGLAFAPSPALADTFQVTKLADTNDLNCSNADCSLREAVFAANALDNGPGVVDEVTFASTVTGTIVLDIATYSNIDISDELTIAGPGADQLAISGGGVAPPGVEDGGIFHASSTTSVTTIGYLTLTNGHSSSEGGAIASSSDLLLQGMTIQNNYAAEGGGSGFSVVGGNATLTDCTVRANDGGGFFVFDGDATLTDSTVSANDGRGFRVFNGNATLINTTVNGNTAPFGNGGGFSVDEGDVFLSNSTVKGNTASNGHGGGFSVTGASPNGNVTVIKSTVSGNTASDFGGGFYVEQGATIYDSTISDNQANAGGGFLVRNGNLILENSTVSGNYATFDGGGFNFSFGGFATITHSTISGNYSGAYGGGFFMFEGNAQLYNSIVADNTAVTNFYAFELRSTASTLTAEASLVEGTSDPQVTGMSNITSMDPDLDPLADNGGPTLTHAIGRESPAYNDGNSASGPQPIPDDDQRGAGFPRVALTTLDMGAYEFQGAAPGCGFTQDFLEVFNITLPEIGSGIDFAFAACVRVTLGPSVTIYDNADVLVLAGEEVKIKAGFTVDLGSTLSVRTGSDAL